MKVLVVGATGKAGKRVVRLLKNSDHAPLAMIRDPAQCSTFDELGVPTVVADLEYPIDHAVRSCDSLIFTTGSGGQFPGKVPAPFRDHDEDGYEHDTLATRLVAAAGRVVQY